MFKYCTYHQLESLIPPSTDIDMNNKLSPIRLEHLCALTIVKDGRNISHTPAHLHKILWQAYLTEKYYENDSGQAYKNKCDPYVNDIKFSFEELPELLYTWPYEELVLKDVMPRGFPPKLERFTNVRHPVFVHDPYYQNRVKLLKFNSMVIYTIIETFTKESSEGELFDHVGYCKIMKINISGFKTYINVEKITEMIAIEKPFLRNRSGKLEIVLDIMINKDPLSFRQIEAGTNMLSKNTYLNPYNSIKLRFEHITIGSYDNSEVTFEGYIKDVLAHGPISVELRGNRDAVSNILESVFDSGAPRDHIQAFKFDGYPSLSLNFLQHLNNLVHLDLEGNSLHGKLDALGNMDRGLVYLNLRSCKLTDEDLVHLQGSSHQSTLQELNLSGNYLDNGQGIPNLVELCNKLTVILRLDLCRCRLQNLSIDMINPLYHSIRTMPNIVILDLLSNDFSVSNVKNLFMTLKTNLSLRYITISIPIEAHENFVTEINELINANRSQLLFVAFRVPILSCGLGRMFLRLSQQNAE